MDCLIKEEEKELQNCLEELKGLEGSSSEKVVFEELKKDIPAEKAQVELKILPKHLKYVFLGENEASPVIINNFLRKEEESRLVKVFEETQGNYWMTYFRPQGN